MKYFPAILFVTVAMISSAASAATFVVTTTDDAGPGSLRQAIDDANNTAGADMITFQIPGSGVHTIAPIGALPSITDPVTIDGYTQPGSSPNTLATGDNAVLQIEINGTQAGTSGIIVSAGNSTLRGLIINRFSGYAIQARTNGGNVIAGNFIGTDATGASASPNRFAINIESGINHRIGGTAPGDRNIISGNSSTAIFVRPAGTFVQGNYIGTNAAGSAALGNSDGVNLDSATNTTVGGTTAAAGNVISGNRNNGVFMSHGNGNVVQGNFIGTNAIGADLGNGNSGVSLDNTTNATIEGNTIAFNGARFDATDDDAAGVLVTANPGSTTAVGNAIRGNSIYSNVALGIDLRGGLQDPATGVTSNDSGDADIGANNLQNFPVLSSVTRDTGSVHITGKLNSTANTAFRIELFANDTVDPSGYGEGRHFLGFTNVMTDAGGNATFNVTLPGVAGAPHVTATATDATGNTSEFSAAIGQLLNISTRLRVQTGDNVLISGFIVTGSQSKQAIVRGIGPSLADLLPGFLADPTIELHDSSSTLAANDNWKVRPDGSSQQAEIEATMLAPTNDAESALVRSLPGGTSGYTAILRGKNDTTGIGVVEAYDLDPGGDSKLANISTRGLVETGDNVLIAGFIVGNGITDVIVRAIGPSLPVSGKLLNPTLELHGPNGDLITSNDDWRSSQEAEILATTLQPSNDLESAIIRSLAPGGYTAIVRGKDNTTGIGLVEVYALK